MDDEVPLNTWSLDPETRVALRTASVKRAFAEGRLTEAALDAEELLDEVPDHPEALFLLAETLLELGDAELAALVYHQRSLAGDESLEVLSGLGVARFESCDVEGAVEALREVVRRAPDDAEAHYVLGLALELLSTEGQNTALEAIAHLTEARDLEPERYPLAIALPAEAWQAALEAAIDRLPEALASVWEGVPVVLEDLPKIRELSASGHPTSPRVPLMYVGEPGDDPEGTLPVAMRVFTRTVARAGSLDAIEDALHAALEAEALNWLDL